MTMREAPVDDALPLQTSAGLADFLTVPMDT
jgi:hypothetical protein